MVEQSCKPEKIEALVPMSERHASKGCVPGWIPASEKADYISGQVIGLNGGMA